MADAKITITADAQQAKEEIDSLGKEINETKGEAESLGTTGGAGVDKFGNAMQNLAKAVAVIELVGTIIQSAGKAVEALDANGVIKMSDETRAWASSLDDLGKSISRLDVIGVGKNLGQVLGNVIVDLTDATRTLTEVNEDAAASLAYLGAEGSAAADRLRSVLQVQRDFVEAQEKAKIAADLRSEAMVRQATVEAQSGEVTKAVADEIQKLLDKYAKLGQEVPPNLQATADKLGILSSAQEKAANAADKAGAAHAKETAEVGKAAAAQDTLLGSLNAIAEGRKAATATVDDSIRALKEEIALYEKEAAAAQKAADDAQARAADSAKRIAELEGKPVVTIDEQNELNDLKDQQATLDGEAADAADNAAQATFEYGEAQASLGENTEAANESLDYASEVMAELDAATADYSATVEAAGDSAASTNAIVESIGENGERSFTNLNEAAGEFGDVIVEVGENGQMVMTNLADGAESAAAALPDAAEGFYQVGDALKSIDSAQGEGGEKKGLEKAIDDVRWFTKEGGPEMLRLAKEIRAELAGFTLGGGGGEGI